MVESGSFRSTQGNEQAGKYQIDGGARTKSNAAPSAMMASSFWKRVSIQRLPLSGITLESPLAIVILKRTSVRAMGVLPKLFTFVLAGEVDGSLDYVCAFLDVHSAYTMMAPAPIRKYHGVLAGPSGEVIRKPSGPAAVPLVV